MLQREKVPQLCESWRDHHSEEGYLSDIVDGQVWKDFQTVDSEPFLSAPRNCMFRVKFSLSPPHETQELLFCWCSQSTWLTLICLEVSDLTGRIGTD